MRCCLLVTHQEQGVFNQNSLLSLIESNCTMAWGTQECQGNRNAAFSKAATDTPETQRRFGKAVSALHEQHWIITCLIIRQQQGTRDAALLERICRESHLEHIWVIEHKAKIPSAMMSTAWRWEEHLFWALEDSDSDLALLSTSVWSGAIYLTACNLVFICKRKLAELGVTHAECMLALLKLTQLPVIWSVRENRPAYKPEQLPPTEVLITCGF